MMERRLKDSYKKTFQFVKNNFLPILVMCGFIYIISMGFIILYQGLSAFLNILLFISIIPLVVGVVLVTEGGGIVALGIVLIILGAGLTLVFLVLVIGSFILVGSFGFGFHILISELLLKLKNEEKLRWKDAWEYISNNYKEVLRKGFRMFLSYLLIIIPLILIINVLYTGLIGSVLYSVIIAPESGAIFTISLIGLMVISTLFFITMLLIGPALWFLIDSTTVRIAEGKKVRTAFRHGFKDLRKNRKGVWQFVIGAFILMILSFILWPIAFIIQPLIPIVSKAFIITNRDMFYD